MGPCSCESCCPLSSFLSMSMCLTSPATPSPVWALPCLHAPPRLLPAACDQARLSARPLRGPWGALPPRWPPRQSRTTASLGGLPTRGLRQLPAGVGAALGCLSGAAHWSPGSTCPHALGPEGKKGRRPRESAEQCAAVSGCPLLSREAGSLLCCFFWRLSPGCCVLGGLAGWLAGWRRLEGTCSLPAGLGPAGSGARAAACLGVRGAAGAGPTC